MGHPAPSRRKFPTARTVLKAIALAEGKLKSSEYYRTKYQIIALAKAWLEANK